MSLCNQYHNHGKKKKNPSPQKIFSYARKQLVPSAHFLTLPTTDSNTIAFYFSRTSYEVNCTICSFVSRCSHLTFSFLWMTKWQKIINRSQARFSFTVIRWKKRFKEKKDTFNFQKTNCFISHRKSFFIWTWPTVHYIYINTTPVPFFKAPLPFGSLLQRAKTLIIST